MARRAPPDSGPEGVLPVDKPAGPTSHDVVLRARDALAERRVGHTGTLDPFATGLLLLCVGRATRLVSFFQQLPKSYRAVILLGKETDTHDRTGAVTRTSDAWRSVTEGEVRRLVEGMQGLLSQVPPAYSAKKVAGRRAFEAARSGEPLALAAQQVVVHAAVLEAFRPPEVHVELVVSAGTYVRALARDLGRELGCLAHVAELRRTAIGPFGVDTAVSWEELAGGAPLASRVIASAEAVSWMPRREITAEEARLVRHGRPLEMGELGEPDATGSSAPSRERSWPVALIREGRLVCIAMAEGGWLKPKKVFHER